jgi:hypothetical protein
MVAGVSYGTWMLWGLAIDLAIFVAVWKFVGLFL